MNSTSEKLSRMFRRPFSSWALTSWWRVVSEVSERRISPSISKMTTFCASRVLMSMIPAFFLLFIKTPPGCQSRAALIEWARKEAPMPLVEIHLLEGRTDEQKKALLSAVTLAVHETIGSPIESIRVWVQEFAPTEYMAA